MTKVSEQITLKNVDLEDPSDETSTLNDGPVYLSCDERAARIDGGCDEADELALVLTVDLAVEVCQPVAVGLQSSECLCMSVKTQRRQVSIRITQALRLLTDERRERGMYNQDPV